MAKKRAKQKKSQDVLVKQLLGDLERRISINVGNFLVLSEQGDPTQIALAHQRAKSEFIKFGPEMHKIAAQMGGPLLEVVDDFLESVDSVLHTTSGWLDEEIVSNCFKTTQRLESELL